jgi:hypothetical protein
MKKKKERDHLKSVEITCLAPDAQEVSVGRHSMAGTLASRQRQMELWRSCRGIAPSSSTSNGRRGGP